MKKKILLALIMVILGVFAAGVTTFAATHGSLTYKISNNEITITDCETSVSGKFTIPDNIDGYPVTSIGYSAFSGCKSLESVTIPDSVTSIGYGAFLDCTSLEDINIPDGVTSIGAEAFSNCTSLTSIIIPDSVTSIGWYAFVQCTNLESITISDSVSIACGAFYNTKYYNNTGNWKDGVLYIDNHLIEASSEIPSNYIIQEGTKTISGNSFEGCESLESITIPGSVTSIGECAFLDCTNLASITVPDSVTSIGDGAFMGCESLASVTIPNSVTSIVDNAFCGCYNLESIIIPDGVTSIGVGAFYCCTSLASITIPDSVTSIGDSAFSYCESLESITIPDSVTSIGECAFDDTGYYNDTANWKNGVLYIDNHLIKANSEIPSNYAIQEGTKTISDFAFSSCSSLESIIIPDGVTSIGVGAFSCESLASVTIPDSVTSIAYSAFYSCTSLTDVYYTGTEEQWNSIYIGSENKPLINATIHYKKYNILIGNGTFVVVTYGSDFSLPPQAKDGYIFVGYYTEEGGKGSRITDEFGNSLKAYDIVGDLTVYPYFELEYKNKLTLTGCSDYEVGDTVSAKVTLGTDKEAMYLVMTIKYPEFLTYKGKKEIDFVEVYEENECESDGYRYIDFTCLYDYYGNNIPVNETIVPFELEFEISKNAPAGIAQIVAENVMLIGNDTYDISDTEEYSFEIKPKLAEKIEITGSNTIDRSTQFIAEIFPDYTTNKAISWSVSDESVATITEDGVLTPVKNGIVTVTASALDGSGVSASMTVDVIAYARLTALDFGEGICLAEFDEDVREYTVYVSCDDTRISITPAFSAGVLRPNGSGIWISGKAKEFTLNPDEPTVITLHRQSVQNMTNSIYTITVVPVDGIKAVVSDDGGCIDVVSPDAEEGDSVVISFFDGSRFMGAQAMTISGGVVRFATDKEYKTAKVMLWDSLSGIEPRCEYEIIE